MLQLRRKRTFNYGGIVLPLIVIVLSMTFMVSGFTNRVTVSSSAAWKKKNHHQQQRTTASSSSSSSGSFLIRRNMASSSTRKASPCSRTISGDSTCGTRLLMSTSATEKMSSSSSSYKKEDSNNALITTPLSEFDPEMWHLLELEEERQSNGLELIASENFCSDRVRAVLGSCLTNKYSEGQVGKRYYGGNTYIDAIESLCQERALDLYGLNEDEWSVNVQPYSGSPANFAVYTALLNPHDRIMGLDLPAGGHLTHGFVAPKSGKRVSASSIYFESMPYTVDSETGYIDYDDMEYRAKMFRPKLLIAGGSAYPREWDYKRMRRIADSVGALFMVDMAHISGLVAAGVAVSPFAYADVVTSTTHKTLRGPRSGMIFSNKNVVSSDAVDAAVFPALQGGPHNNNIGALAVALREASTPQFVQYGRAVLENAQTLADELTSKYNCTLVTDGTDNHLVLWKVFSGSKVEKLFDAVSITTNKNSVVGDTSALNPGGIRLGTPALTSRGFDKKDFEIVASYLSRGYQLALKLQQHLKEEKDGEIVKVADFVRVLEQKSSVYASEIEQLRLEVESFSSKFYMPGGYIADNC